MCAAVALRAKTTTRGKTAAKSRARAPAKPPAKPLSTINLRDVIPNLHSTTMLVRLIVRQWTARKTDRLLAQEVATAHKSDAGMHSHQRRLVAKRALEKIQRTISEAKLYHYGHTRPWDGTLHLHILKASSYLEYMQKMRGFQSQFEAAVKEFIENFPAEIEAARQLLGTSFSEADYPNPVELAKMFSLDIKMLALPKRDDFRVPEIGEDAENEIRDQIEQHTREAVSEAMRAVWVEIHGQVDRMINALVAYDDREKRKDDGDKSNKGIFRDSLVENMRDLVERLPVINLTDDPKVEAMRKQLERQLCSTSPEDLRTSAGSRAAVLERAQKIRQAVSELI